MRSHRTLKRVFILLILVVLTAIPARAQKNWNDEAEKDLVSQAMAESSVPRRLALLKQWNTITLFRNRWSAFVASGSGYPFCAGLTGSCREVACCCSKFGSRWAYAPCGTFGGVWSDSPADPGRGCEAISRLALPYLAYGKLAHRGEAELDGRAL
jgi:hypothetical protein